MSEVTLDDRVFEVPESLAKEAHIDAKRYEEMYRRSVDDPEGFWADIAEEFITWYEKWDQVLEWDFRSARIRWFEGAKLNACYNCVDRHVEAGRGDNVALIWEGNEPSETQKLTYKDLHEQVQRAANVLKKHGVGRGDRVCVYLPMILELPITLLACARIGAIHSVVFGGFSPDSLRDRINDSECKVLVTSDGTFRGKKPVDLKGNADAAVSETPSIEKVIVVKRNEQEVEWKDLDVWWHDEMASVEAECPCEPMDAEDPLFILYTSGSTGKPKGVLHTTGGYLTYTAATHKHVFDYKDGDVYWCTADIGWVTGHSYIVYGPLANGAISVMFEGVPSYPDMGRFWEIVEKHRVNQFYTAPTAIRAIAKEGDTWPKQHDLSSLRILGTVGEPINPEAWMWYYETIGGGRCPIVDTYWQTETGGFLITPFPGATAIKPGSATRPFFGVQPCIVDDEGNELEGVAQGNFCMKFPWPGMMRSVYGDHERFRETYFSQFSGKYFTGDGAKRDADGYYWITGRVDDVINVSGHRMGTAEVESALVSHDAVAEAAVVGYPHAIKGQGIYAYVTLNSGVERSEELKKELVKHVRAEIGPIATPDVIQWADALPKTRSGKIMRRILKRISAGKPDEIGDTTTLADPAVVDTLVSDSEALLK